MPTLNCLCNEPINLSLLPNPHGFKLIPERSLEPLVDALTAAHAETSSDRDFSRRAWATLREPSLSVLQVYECPSCGRLAVFRHASDAAPIAWYHLDRDAIGSADTRLSALLRDGHEAAERGRE